MTSIVKLARTVCLFFFLTSIYSATVTGEENTYKPFILAENTKQTLADAKSTVSRKLTDAGFIIAGEYSPYKNTSILIVTNETLKKAASLSELGSFGVAQRVSLTQKGDEVQISYTNPIYMAQVYRMKQDLDDIARQLENALGKQKTFGPEEGLTKAELRSYQYKWLMPYFTDSLELATYSSQDIALKKINDLFAKNKSGVTKVYQIDIPNKQETVIGVNMTGSNGNECSGDEYIMTQIDFKKLKSSGHLPYEVVISKGTVYTLPAEFRIAINFPDLSMMGENSFMSIMCAPEAIQAALTTAVGGEGEFDADD